jgi:hypothetical protein
MSGMTWRAQWDCLGHWHGGHRVQPQQANDFWPTTCSLPDAPTVVRPLQEDKDEIINAMRSETKSLGLIDTSENCWAVFIQKVKTNLHMVFTASPVGENFRVRSQRFLATVTSTVIDWFQPWPEASLFSVAKKFLDEIDLGEDALRSAVVEFMPYSFALVNKVSKSECCGGSASAWRTSAGF